MVTSHGTDLLSSPYENITYRSAVVLMQSDKSLPVLAWLNVEEKKLVQKHASRIARNLDGNESTVLNDWYWSVFVSSEMRVIVMGLHWYPSPAIRLLYLSTSREMRIWITDWMSSIHIRTTYIQAPFPFLISRWCVAGNLSTKSASSLLYTGVLTMNSPWTIPDH